MSSRRSGSGQSSGASRISDAQIADLVSKLQQLIPEIANRRSGSSQVSALKVLQETCNHIRNLHKEVSDLSGRLSQLLESTDTNSAPAAVIRSLLIDEEARLEDEAAERERASQGNQVIDLVTSDDSSSDDDEDTLTKRVVVFGLTAPNSELASFVPKDKGRPQPEEKSPKK
ncbi:hypothetical protein POM88_032688 [Heracleum sosnowskyi]|uniref:BHLH domain-containing protein n=1 Tax=Heracleum sosnowskyi TaxID=360622 RepID=A0AAD8I2P5_9APIA|nr:hypothetical protein POM88_032688 [Heracleum sosnowskyi]